VAHCHTGEFIISIVVVVVITISFMQGIYTYIPETNNVPKEYNVAAILSLLFMVPISLARALALMYFHISTFRSMCAMPNMAVFCSLLLLLLLLLTAVRLSPGGSDYFNYYTVL
jgi:magnesium-transporting ATPase (P-type)